MSRLNSFRELEHLRERLREERQNITTTVMVCGGTGCQASRSRAVIEAVRNELSQQGLDSKVRLCVTGCHGFCEQGPVMVIEPGNIFYCHVSPDDAFEIVSQTVVRGEVIERLLYTTRFPERRVRTESEIPFYRAQDRQILSQNRLVDPCSIEDYIAAGGYSALAKVLERHGPGGRLSRKSKPPGCGDAAAAVSRPGASGPSAGRRPEMRSMSSATRTKATPGPIWTGACSRAIRTWCWKA